MELLSILWVPNYSMDGGRLMTALEAKRTADKFNLDLYNSVLNKTSNDFSSKPF